VHKILEPVGPDAFNNLLPITHERDRLPISEARYGIIPGEHGDVAAIELTPGWSTLSINALLRLCENLHTGPDTDFYRTLGFDQVTYSATGEVEWAVLPTAGRLNTGLRYLYAEEGEPPFRFVSKHDRRGWARGKEFIERLAEGEVIIATPLDLHAFEHDMKAHVRGYCRLDPKTFAHLQKQAQALRDQGKLEYILSDGSLGDMDARRFAGGVDSLSNYMQDAEKTGMRYKKLCRVVHNANDNKNLQLDALQVAVTAKRLQRHQAWLRQRVNELQRAA
jgi:hypothetical protein